MSAEQQPFEIIADLADSLRPLSDADVVKFLEAIPPLADESDSCWNDDAYWMSAAFPYLAATDAASRRKLREAIPMLLERMSFGDPGEIMRGMCHAFEAIVNPGWNVLLPHCLHALQSPRPGTRYWAAFQLSRLKIPEAIPALEFALNDQEPEVREAIETSLR